MNYFAHGRPFIDDPYFLAGTAVPDWLNVVDRRVRVRRRQALLHVDAADPLVARVAAGDRAALHATTIGFIGTRAFAELSLGLCRLLRRTRCRPTKAFGPHFLGHILVELLLDAELIAEDPSGWTTTTGASMPRRRGRGARRSTRSLPRPARDLGTFHRRCFRESGSCPTTRTMPNCCFA